MKETLSWSKRAIRGGESSPRRNESQTIDHFYPYSCVSRKGLKGNQRRINITSLHWLEKMFGEQHFLPDSIISIWTKVVFLSLKEKSASKACVLLSNIFPNTVNYSEHFTISKYSLHDRYAISEGIKKGSQNVQISTLSKENFCLRETGEYMENIENFLGSGEIFANTLARRVLVDRPLSEG